MMILFKYDKSIRKEGTTKMPYINVNLKQSISKDTKLAIMKGLGKAIQLIPGKTQEGLMVQVTDGCDLYFRGKEMEKIAFVDVCAYKSAHFEHNKLFVEETNHLLSSILDMPVSNIYLNIVEHSHWGVRGTYK